MVGLVFQNPLGPQITITSLDHCFELGVDALTFNLGFFDFCADFIWIIAVQAKQLRFLFQGYQEFRLTIVLALGQVKELLFGSAVREEFLQSCLVLFGHIWDLRDAGEVTEGVGEV